MLIGPSAAQKRIEAAQCETACHFMFSQEDIPVAPKHDTPERTDRQLVHTAKD